LVSSVAVHYCLDFDRPSHPIRGLARVSCFILILIMSAQSFPSCLYWSLFPLKPLVDSKILRGSFIGGK
jgi:hypothetical protein